MSQAWPGRDERIVGNMSELNWPYGYVWSLLLMAGIGLGLVAFVWRKGWLNSADR